MGESQVSALSMSHILTSYNRFGAVLEEFEVRDALGGIFSEKDNSIPALGHAIAAQQISVH